MQVRPGRRTRRAARPHLPLRPDLLPVVDGQRAEMPIGGHVAVAMIDGGPQTQRDHVIGGIIPARANHRSGIRAEDRLVPQVQVIAVMAVVTVHSGRTRAYLDIRPPRAIVAHKYAVIDIPGFVMVHKRGRTLRNRFTAVVRAMLERRWRGSLARPGGRILRGGRCG